ncbi:MAG: hypothetical protein ACFN0W_11970 [Propionibacterium acidifaciens]
MEAKRGDTRVGGGQPSQVLLDRLAVRAEARPAVGRVENRVDEPGVRGVGAAGLGLVRCAGLMAARLLAFEGADVLQVAVDDLDEARQNPFGDLAVGSVLIVVEEDELVVLRVNERV